MTVRKREVAAFLANVSLETDNLVSIESQKPETYANYCDPNDRFGCPAGASAYFERGPIQVAWSFNYKAAGEALGYDLLNNPHWVATDANLSWQTSGCYWNSANGPGGDGGNSHNAMLNSNASGGMGETIKHINGKLECPSMGGENTASRDARIERYKFFCDQLGVSYGNNLGC